MRGMDAKNGKPLSGMDHLRQSIRDILTTPIGSRVMRRDYGSRLFDLIDSPSNRELIVEIYAAVIEALNAWEPRVLIKRVSVTSAQVGRIEIDLEGTYLPEGRTITLENLVIE